MPKNIQSRLMHLETRRIEVIGMIFVVFSLILGVFVLASNEAQKSATDPDVLGATSGTTYYVDNVTRNSQNQLVGSDSNNGTSPTTPWLSLSKVNSQNFAAGSKILFRGTFTGRLYFDSNDKGTASAPIEIGSIDNANRATIKNTTDNAFMADNTAGIYLHDLNFEGPGSQHSTQIDGVAFYMDMDNVKLDYLRIENLNVSKWSKHGLYFGSWKGTSGYKNVSIKYVNAFDNGESGIFSYAESLGAHQNIYLGYSKAYDNPGRTGLNRHTGNGIMLSKVDGAVVEYNEAYNNGTLGGAQEGPIGIWAYDSNNVTFQFNHSHHNKTNGTADGGGFDIEGVTNSVFQYNLSNDNDGAGFGLYQYSGAPTWSNNTIRYNYSINDARKNTWYGGISLWSASGMTMTGAKVYNNTIYVSANGTSETSGIAHLGGDYSNFSFYNNNIYVASGLKLVRFDSPKSGTVFQGNNYYTPGAFKISWGSTTYSSLSAWRATGQEKLAGLDVGTSVDPGFVNVGGSTPADYKLTSASSLKEAGLNLTSLLTIDMGTRDYFGTSIPQGLKLDVGAHELPLLVNAVCGNGQLESGEVCDDGNTNNNDQCSSTCQNSCTAPQQWNGSSCVSVPTCKADYNVNGIVDVADFGVFAQNYKSPTVSCELDLTGNCFLDIADFGAFSQVYKNPDSCKL